MFRRLPSGLPADPIFPADLEKLGYFIDTETDEIRNIKDPKSYFKYFLTRNERYNDIQREAMNDAIRQEVSARLTTLGLQKLLLPLGAKSTDRHTPIFTSPNLSTASRIIILFNDPSQDLGILAYRIIGGQGGINAGSAINFVNSIISQASGDDVNTTSNPPAIILANMGQLKWWRKGKKAISQHTWWALPQNSAVEPAYRFDHEKNTIPGNRTAGEHVDYIFNTVLDGGVRADATIQVVGVGHSNYELCTFLQDEKMFEKWCESGRLTAFAAVATYWQAHDFKNEELKVWFHDHARVYAISDEPTGTFIVGPHGNRKNHAYGANTYSLGESRLVECMLPKGYETIIDWFTEVANTPGYVNKVMERVEEDDDDEGVLMSWGGDWSEKQKQEAVEDK